MEKIDKSKKPKVLFFLSDSLMAKLFEDVFVKAGFEVGIYYTYSDVVELVLEEKPDILLCDIFIGRTAREIETINGFQAIESLKENEITKNVPIIILTTLCYQESVDQGLEAGALKYLCLTEISPYEVRNVFIEELIKRGKFTKKDFGGLIKTEK